MKKFVVVLLASLALVGMAGAAETSNGQLVVNGTVTGYTLLSVTNSPITVTFAGTGAAGTANRDASLNLKANRPTWTITFHSASGGLLVSENVEASSKIPYYLQVVPGTLPSGMTLTNGLSAANTQLTEDKTVAATAAGRTPKAGIDFTLKVTAADQADADILWQADTAYTDTVTITVSQP
ncbi:MAG TPA: hypothetical protein VIO60_02545 [Rectinemataceae bacterium]